LMTTEANLKFRNSDEFPHHIQIRKLGSSRVGNEEKLEYILLAVDITEQENMRKQLEDERVLVAQSSRLSSIGEMAAGIAHEIKNPLTILQGNLSILTRDLNLNKIDVEKFKDKIQTLIKTTQRISDSINSVLRLSRESSSSDHEWIPLAQMIQDPLVLCMEKFRQQKVRLTIDPISEDIEVLCQAQQLGQVILNLLNNAFDATNEIKSKPDEEASGPSRLLELLLKETSTGGLLISVTDNGPGVKDPTRLFASFYTTKPVGYGTGLGLSLCKKIMEQHSGEIRYERKDSKTYFTLEIPSSKVRKTSRAA
jgi:two-component system, LuxR family, sensor histidine kinase DctS